jgi:hypothetical protein
MKKHINLKQFFFASIVIISMVYFGCERKTGEAGKTQGDVKTEEVKPDTTSDSSGAAKQEPVEKMKITIPVIKGKWTGTFDKRSTVLTITEQTDSSFTGKISISYREVINQEVKGTLSPSTMKMSMTDQLHSRYQGKYDGKLSEDGNSYTGTFTMKLDGSKFSFDLNKK